MKVDFDIPEQLYRKFQAAMIIKEESEEDVIINLISEYIKNLFSQPVELNKEQNAKIKEQKSEDEPKRRNPYEQKKLFVEWFKSQTYRGRPYNPVTISGYSGRIENACQSPEFRDIATKNLFEISDVMFFRKIREEIEQCVGFSGFDAASHGGFTAALNMYDRFLCTQTPDRVSDDRSPTAKEFHRWTYAEDELCCKEYFDVYIINRRNTDLTRFAMDLSRELPDISLGSIKMKAQNIKYLCEINGIKSSLTTKSLNQYSAQCKNAFQVVCELYKKKGCI